MDIGRAFSFVFDDAEWVKKVVVGGLLSLIPLVGSLIVYGYMLEVAGRAYSASEREMPEWDDIGGYLVRGLILYAAYLIWILPAILLLVCGVLAVILGALATGERVVFGLSIAAIIVLSPLVYLVSLLASILLPVLLGRYAIERRFGALFAFGAIVADIRRIGWVPLLLLLVTVLAAQTLASFGIVLCFIGVIFTSFYANLVVAHGAGQVYRGVRELEPAQSPSTNPLV